MGSAADLLRSDAQFLAFLQLYISHNMTYIIYRCPEYGLFLNDVGSLENIQGIVRILMCSGPSSLQRVPYNRSLRAISVDRETITLPSI